MVVDKTDVVKYNTFKKEKEVKFVFDGTDYLKNRGDTLWFLKIMAGISQRDRFNPYDKGVFKTYGVWLQS